MLRYSYLLSLLICFHLSFCYEYSLDLNPRRRSIGRIKTDHQYQRDTLQHKKHRKRHDYDMYDKEPVAEIDVASFINNGKDDSYDENDHYNLNYNKQQNDYFDSLTNDLSNNNEEYADIDADNSRNNINYPFSKDKVMSQKFTNEIKRVQDNQDESLFGQDKEHHKEKKCVLKHLKLPFFSHNKSAIAKIKSDKKRKIYSFHDLRKSNIIHKGNDNKLLKNDNSRDNLHLSKQTKLKKRSYIERLCPACRRQFLGCKSFKSQTDNYKIFKNIYDQTSQNSEGNLDDDQKPLNRNEEDSVIQRSQEKGTFDHYWSDRRKREDDDRNIERQKELEYLEKRVESVTVNNPSYNKNKM